MTLALIILASFAAGCVCTYLVLRAIAEVHYMVDHILPGNPDDWWI